MASSASRPLPPSPEDASGKVLKVGNIVETLSPFCIQKVLPAKAKEADIRRLANKIGTIHDILGSKIYLEIHSEHCMTSIKPEVTIFQDEGLSVGMGDEEGSVGRIGSLVQILSDQQQVKNLAGKVGWIHGMEETCEKTGRIVRILRNSDVLVQFAWGPRFYYQPKALLPSHNAKLETQDFRGNWIHVGSLVQVTKTLSEFIQIQMQNNLPHDLAYSDLPQKYATVKAIRLLAFTANQMVRIVFKEFSYNVHVTCLELVDNVKDSNSNSVRVGDEVQVTKDKGQLKLIQEDKPQFGGWIDEMSEILGQVGKVVKLCVDDKSKFNDVVVQVEFTSVGSHAVKLFYLNPRIIQIWTGASPEISMDVAETPVHDEWEKIERSNLKCFDILGQGAFGCVLRGEWTRNGIKMKVAIKQVLIGILKGGGTIERLLEEAKIQYTLKHPNIVALLGISIQKDLWIVMDLVDGKDLFDLLFNGDGETSGITFKQKVKLSLDMSNAIAYVHQRGFIHCDIKPQNMMVDSSGKLFVCDFGLTKFLGNMDFMTFATQYTNNAAGTLYYIAPECVQIDDIMEKYRKPTFAADVWSLGAVFYELFTEKRLFHNTVEVLRCKSRGDDNCVKKQLINLPQQLFQIVSRSLNFNYHDRPKSQQLYECFHELYLKL